MTAWFAETPDLLQRRAEVAVEAGTQITLLRLWEAEVPSDLEHLSWEILAKAWLFLESWGAYGHIFICSFIHALLGRLFWSLKFSPRNASWPFAGP